MDLQLFFTTFNNYLHTCQSSITDIFLKRKNLSEKLKLLSLSLLHFKLDIIKSIQTYTSNLIPSKQNKEKSKINANSQQKSITNLYKKQIQLAQQKIFKINLHTLLRKKLGKLKEESINQSMALSSLNNTNCFNFESQGKLNQLQNSVLILEKQLGFQDDQDDLGVTNIIQKSMMMSLQSSHINFNKINDNESIFSENSIVQDIQYLKIHTQNDSKQSNQNQKSVIQGSIQEKIKLFTTTKKQQYENKIIKDKEKQKKELSKQKLSNKTDSIKSNRRVIDINKPPLAQTSKIINQKLKKKKEGGVLGNLLEESYQNCLND